MYLKETGIDGANWVGSGGGLLFDQLGDYQLFREYTAPWSE
jgi:hypothetical protein